MLIDYLHEEFILVFIFHENSFMQRCQMKPRKILSTFQHRFVDVFNFLSWFYQKRNFSTP